MLRCGLYYDEKRETWVNVSKNQQEEACSCVSSPIGLSPPGSVSSMESSDASFSDHFCFDDAPSEISKLKLVFLWGFHACYNYD